MLTQVTYDALVAKNQKFQDAIDEYKAYLKGLGLSFSADHAKLIMQFKAIQFSKLMSTDKGLAMEYNTLLKSDEAKAKKINDKIDLTGWDEPALIVGYLDTLELMLKHFNVGSSHGENFAPVTLKKLVEQCDGSVSEYLKQFVLSWEGLEDYKLLFDNAYKALTDLIPVFNKMGNSIMRIESITNLLADAAKPERVGDKIVSVTANEAM